MRSILSAVFARMGSFGSSQSFISGFGPAMLVAAGLSLLGAIAGLFLLAKVRKTALGPTAKMPDPAEIMEKVGTKAG